MRLPVGGVSLQRQSGHAGAGLPLGLAGRPRRQPAWRAAAPACVRQQHRAEGHSEGRRPSGHLRTAARMPKQRLLLALGRMSVLVYHDLFAY